MSGGGGIIHLNLFEQKGYHKPIRQTVYEPLLHIEGDGTLTPRLAKSWELDAATSTWTFYLQEGVTWHDGEPFTAHDVKYTVDTAKELQGAYWSTWAKYVEETTVVNDLTIEMELVAPYTGFPSMLREERAEILPKHIWEDEDAETWLNLDNPIGTGPFKFKEGNFTEYVLLEKNTDYWGGTPKIDEIMLTTFADTEAHLMALRLGTVDAIGGKTLTNKAVISTLMMDPNIEVAINNSNRYDMLRINLRREPNNVKEFRHALSWAIDREGICEQVYYGYAFPSGEVPYIPPSLQDEDAMGWPGMTKTLSTVSLEFNDNGSADTIVRTTGSFVEDGWEVGYFVDVDNGARGTQTNEGTYEIAAVTATTLTLTAAAELTDAASATGMSLKVNRIDTANKILDGITDMSTIVDGVRSYKGTPLSFEILIGTTPAHFRAAEVVEENMEDIGIEVSVKTMSFSALFAVLKNTASDWDWYLGGQEQPVSWDAGFASWWSDPDAWGSFSQSGPIGFDEPVLQGKMLESLTASGATRDALIVEIQELWADYLPFITLHGSYWTPAYRTDNLTGWDLEQQMEPVPTALEPLVWRNLLKLEPVE
jgi:ABC-type transport system substrate-binding protein